MKTESNFRTQSHKETIGQKIINDEIAQKKKTTD